MRDLQRLLWRYETGLVSTEQITSRFEQHLSALVNSYREGSLESGAENQPGKHDFSLRVDFDRTLNSAQTQLAEHNFKRALEDLKAAKSALKKLKLTVIARTEIQHAQGTCDHLFRLSGTTQPNATTDCEIVRRLLAKSKSLLEQGQARQARFVASMCRKKSEKLLYMNQDGSEVVQELRIRIAEICEVQGGLSRIPFRGEDVFVFETLPNIEKIIHEGRLELARSMLDDLELAIAPRKAFLSELTRQFGRADADRVASLLHRCGITTSDSWQSATNRLLEHALNELTLKINKLGMTVKPVAEATTAYV